MNSYHIVTAVDCRDVRSTECRDAIAKKIIALRVGEKLCVEAEHDPLPAVMPLKLDREHPDEFVWAYGETNPKWQLEIERVSDTAKTRDHKVTPEDEDHLMRSLSFEDRYKAI